MHFHPHRPYQVEFDFMGRPVTANASYRGVETHIHAGLRGYAYVDLIHHAGMQDDATRNRRVERENTKRDSRVDVSIHVLEPDYNVSSIYYDFSYNLTRRYLIDGTFASMMYTDGDIDTGSVVTERVDASIPVRRRRYIREYLSQGAQDFNRPNILDFGESRKIPQITALDVPSKELVIEISHTTDTQYDIMFKQNGVEYTTRFHRDGAVDLKTTAGDYADELCFSADGRFIRINYPDVRSLQS